MTITPDALAANYDPESGSDPATEVEALATMAAEYGYRLVPIDQQDVTIGAVPPAFPDDPDAKIRRLTWLHYAIKAAKASVQAHNSEKAQLTEEIIEDWVRRTHPSQTLDEHTISLKQTYSLKKVDPDVSTTEILNALVVAGLGDEIFQTYSSMSLLSKIKEYDAKEIPMPDALAGIFTLKKGFDLSVTPAAKQRTTAIRAAQTA